MTMDSPTTDTLGARIVEKGFAPNLALLDINNSLSVPHGFELHEPWNLPSRLFRFPIEVCCPRWRPAAQDRPSPSAVG
ncbi:hypothetical protein [Rhizobium sp. A37_96]